MEVYRGTGARFLVKELTYGPDTAAQLGTPMPWLWLTTDPKLAATYASWSADCTKSNYLRVIALEMNEDCPRWHNPRRKEDFVVRSPEREYENGNLKGLRAYRVRRKKVFDPNSGQSVAWQSISFVSTKVDSNRLLLSADEPIQDMALDSTVDVLYGVTNYQSPKRHQTE